MSTRYRLPLYATRVGLPNGSKEASSDGWFYPVNSAEEEALIAIGCVGDDLGTPNDGQGVLSPMQVAALRGTQIEATGFHYNNTPAQNVAAFNLAASRRGLLTLSTPGQYLLGGPDQDGILVYGNSAIVCADGVELILADETFAPLIRNANAFATGIPLNAVVTWLSGAPSFRARVDYPGVHLLYPVGSRFGLLGLLGSNSSNRGYQGVWQVQSVAEDQIFFHLKHQPPSGGPSAATGVIYPVDSNIRIIGGLWDGNGTGNDASGDPDGAPVTLIQAFRNAQNLVCSNMIFRKGQAWCIGTNNVRDATFSDIDADTYAGIGVVQAHDIVHIAGGARNVLVERITADCDDNIVGLTLDVLGAPGNAQYDHYDPGDTYDIRIKDITGRETSASLVALWGNTNYMHHAVEVDGVYGKSPGSAVQMMTYGPTNMLNVNGGRLSIRNVSGAYQEAVKLRGDGNWEKILIEDVRNEYVATGSAVVDIGRNTTAQTIKVLEIRNVDWSVQGSGSGRDTSLIKIENSNIDSLRIEGVEDIPLKANVSLITHTGSTGVIKKAVVQGATANSVASGDSFIFSCENTGAGAIVDLTVRDADMVGTSNTGGIVRQTAGGKVTRVRVDNVRVTSAEGKVVLEGTGATATEVSTGAVS